MVLIVVLSLDEVLLMLVHRRNNIKFLFSKFIKISKLLELQLNLLNWAYNPKVLVRPLNYLVVNYLNAHQNSVFSSIRLPLPSHPLPVSFILLSHY